jgi:serine/threonine protein kinase
MIKRYNTLVYEVYWTWEYVHPGIPSHFPYIYIYMMFNEISGLFNCRYTWLHCSGGPTEERIWNGMWLVSLVLLNLCDACLEDDAPFLIFTFCRWSLGAIMYEMLVGYPPFYSEDPMSTCRKVNFDGVFTSTMLILSIANSCSCIRNLPLRMNYCYH